MKRSKHGLFVFLPKKTLIWRRHCSIGQSCCSMTSKRNINWFLEVIGHEVFSPERSLNQPKATRVCIRSINQSNRSISVCLLFVFCSRVFISRSYENRSIVAFRYSLLQSYSLSFTVYSISFHSLLFFTVILFLSIPFTVYFIPIFCILFTVYFQLNFIPFHFTVHCLLRPFPFRSLFS